MYLCYFTTCSFRICLPEVDDDFADMTGNVAGWGRKNIRSRRPMRNLKKMSASIRDQSFCNDQFNGQLTSRLMCASGLERASLCKFDEGGNCIFVFTLIIP